MMDFVDLVTDNLLEFLKQHGFKDGKISGVLLKATGTGYNPWIGLNHSEINESSFLLNPVIGICVEPIQKKFSEIFKCEYSRYFPPTVSANCEFFMADWERYAFEKSTYDLKSAYEIAEELNSFSELLLKKSKNLDSVGEMLVDGHFNDWNNSTMYLAVIGIIKGYSFLEVLVFLEERLEQAKLDSISFGRVSTFKERLSEYLVGAERLDGI